MTTVYVNAHGVAPDGRWFPSSLAGATVTVDDAAPADVEWDES